MAKCIDEFKMKSGKHDVACTIYALQRSEQVMFYATYTIENKASQLTKAHNESFDLFQPRDGIVLSQFKEYVVECINDKLNTEVKELA